MEEILIKNKKKRNGWDSYMWKSSQQISQVNSIKVVVEGIMTDEEMSASTFPTISWLIEQFTSLFAPDT